MVKRREWSDEKKRELVAETKADGVTTTAVAKRHKVSVSQLHRWVRDPRFGGEAHEPDFVEVAVEEPAMRPLTEPRIEITLTGGHRIVIEGVFDPASVVPLVRSFVV